MKYLYSFVFFVLLGLSACIKDPETPPDVLLEDPLVVSEVAEEVLVKSNNDLGLRLLNALSDSSLSNQNFAISPISLGMSLGLLMNAADNYALETLSNTLSFDSLTLLDINQTYQDLSDELITADQHTLYSSSSSVWYPNSIAINPAFQTINDQYFDYQLNSIDYALESMKINQWLEERSNSRLRTTTSIVDEFTSISIQNFSSFSAPWTSSFDETKSYQKFFELLDGTDVVADMLYHPKLSFRYHKDLLVEIADIPYGDGRFSMTIISPTLSENIKSLIQYINGTLWDNWMDALNDNIVGDSVKVQLQIPKFNLNKSVNLNQALKRLGMKGAFDYEADFSQFGDNASFVSNLEQSVSFSVDETGLVPDSSEIPSNSLVEIPSMVVDKPFIFAIRDSYSGAILLVGVILNPSL